MINKTVVATKAASVKSTLDDLHDAIDALPDGDQKAALQAIATRLHAKLNGAAIRLADFFETDVSTFSGGTDKDAED